MTSTERLYRTTTMLERTLRVAYPAGSGEIVLRTEQDWERDLLPVAVSDDGQISTFRLQADQPFLYFKPCLIQNGRHHWSVGANKLLLMGEEDQRLAYPYFLSPEHGQFSPLIEFPSRLLGRSHLLRVYVPPGYHENTLTTFPVLHAGRPELWGAGDGRGRRRWETFGVCEGDVEGVCDNQVLYTRVDAIGRGEELVRVRKALAGNTGSPSLAISSSLFAPTDQDAAVLDQARLEVEDGGGWRRNVEICPSP